MTLPFFRASGIDCADPNDDTPRNKLLPRRKRRQSVAERGRQRISDLTPSGANASAGFMQFWIMRCRRQREIGLGRALRTPVFLQSKTPLNSSSFSARAARTSASSSSAPPASRISPRFVVAGIQA